MQNSEKNAEGRVTDQCRAGKFMLGITGGVGSGKSRILAILKEDYGFHVIQADQAVSYTHLIILRIWNLRLAGALRSGKAGM